MNWIKIVIQEPNKPERQSIHPETALNDFMRVWGKYLVDYYVVDANGNRLNETIKVSENAKDRALRLLKENAKKLNIEGYEAMTESELLASIQKVNNNSSNQTSVPSSEPVSSNKVRKVKKRKQNA